jgi:hypothetical protein
MAENPRLLRLLELLHDPNDYSWISIAFQLENIPFEQINMPLLLDHARKQYQDHHQSIQSVLSSKAHAILSNKSQIVQFLKGNFTTKKRVNCFGAALVSYFIALANEIPCTFYSSETHSWIELHDNDCQLVDVTENLKAAKKSKLPLSIYSNKQSVDSFGVCLMLICNDNPLPDEDILYILNHFKERLKHSWEISKFFTLSHSLQNSSSLSFSSSSPPSSPHDIRSPSLPSISLLDTIPDSFELIFQKVLYYLNQHDLEKMFQILQSLILQTTQLCQNYSVNSDLWFDEDSSFLALTEEICEKIQEGKSNELMDLESVRERYEDWIEKIVELCCQYLSEKSGEKWRRQVPMLSGKRRRIEKRRES